MTNCISIKTLLDLWLSWLCQITAPSFLRALRFSPAYVPYALSWLCFLSTLRGLHAFSCLRAFSFLRSTHICMCFTCSPFLTYLTRLTCPHFFTCITCPHIFACLTCLHFFTYFTCLHFFACLACPQYFCGCFNFFKCFFDMLFVPSLFYNLWNNP